MIYILFCIIYTNSAMSWFGPPPGNYGAIAITRVNQYNTSTNPSPWDISVTDVSIYEKTFFDYGDTNYIPDHVAGRMATNAFYCGYPITFNIWIRNSSTAPSGYSSATLEYFQGTNSLNSTNWINISTITNFIPVQGIEGAHFGVLTWTPPYRTNELYLVRIWAGLKNGMQSADKKEENIDKDGNAQTWKDSEVVLIKVRDKQVPGYVEPLLIIDNGIVKETKPNIFTKCFRKFIALFKKEK